jgi:hypothetical protein
MAWNASYATAVELAAWNIDADAVTDVAELDLAIGAASRAVGRAAGRQFGLTDVEDRVYSAEFDRNRWVVDIDDVMVLDDLTVTVGGVEADYILGPPNSVVNGRPYTRLTLPTGRPLGLVTVTAQFGWPVVPDAIKLATLIQASRLFARRDATSGPLSSQRIDDVSYSWAATDLDSDVAASVAPYRRVWGAV